MPATATAALRPSPPPHRRRRAARHGQQGTASTPLLPVHNERAQPCHNSLTPACLPALWCRSSGSGSGSNGDKLGGCGGSAAAAPPAAAMGQAGADCLGTCGELAGCLAGILGYTLLCMSMSLVVHGLACTNLARAAHSLGVLLQPPSLPLLLADVLHAVCAQGARAAGHTAQDIYWHDTAGAGACRRGDESRQQHVKQHVNAACLRPRTRKHA